MYAAPIRVAVRYEKLLMVSWAITLFLIALLAAFVASGGVAAWVVGLANIIFTVALMLAITSLMAGRRSAV